jgi:hypothetical protein
MASLEQHLSFVGEDIFCGNPSFQKGIPLKVKVLFVGGDPGIADKHRRVC